LDWLAEEPDTKMQKKLAKIKFDFFDFFWLAVLAGAVALLFF
jgi:hypothetical protein